MKKIIRILLIISTLAIGYFCGMPFLGSKIEAKGEKFYYLKDYKKAIRYYSIAEVLKRGRGKISPKNSIGYCYLNLNDYGSASEKFKEVLKIDSKKESASRGLVNALFNMEKYEEAEELAKERLKYSMVPGTVFYQLATIHRAKEEPEKALEYAMKKVVYDENYIGATSEDKLPGRFLLASVFYDLGKYKEAIETLETIYEELDPKLPLTYKMLAIAHERAGDKDKALENWQKFLSLDHYKPSLRQYAEQKVAQIKTDLGIIQ